MREPAAISPSHSRLGLHRSKLRLLNAGSLELGKESLQYRPNVAQEENRSERVTLLDPDIILDGRLYYLQVFTTYLQFIGEHYSWHRAGPISARMGLEVRRAAMSPSRRTASQADDDLNIDTRTMYRPDCTVALSQANNQVLIFD